MPAEFMKRTGFSARGENPHAIRLTGRDELSLVRVEAAKSRVARLFSAISIL